MHRALALAVVLAITPFLGSMAGGTVGLRTTVLALGIALIAASLAGNLLERVRLPRVTAYLLFGIVCGPYVLNVITRQMARELQILNSLAIALIAFIAGLEVNLSRLAPKLGAIVRLGVVTLAVMYAGLFAVFWTAWPLLPIAPEIAGLGRMAMAFALTTIVVSFSPAVTIAVIAESRARGPLSELTLAVVILGELALIVLFTLSLQWLREALGPAAAGDVPAAIRLAWELLGSLALGAALGGLFALYLKHVRRELSVVLLTLCALLARVSYAVEAETLVAALAAGFVVENILPAEGDALKEAVERAAPPILIVFFTAAGASLQIDALSRFGLLAAGVALLRIGLLKIGVGVGAAAAGIRGTYAGLAWMGFVSQAGVVLGLAVILAGEFPTWGRELQTFVIALVAINQLAGPALFRAALGRAGEVGRVDDSSAPQQPQIRDLKEA